MTFSLASIKWGWVVLGVIIALLIAYGSSICVVTIYAGFLGFQARGAPDQEMINAFANLGAGAITAVAAGVGTLLGGLLAGRKATVDALQNGLTVGVVTALILLLMGIFGGFNLWTFVGIMLAVSGGWLGGSLAGR